LERLEPDLLDEARRHALGGEGWAQLAPRLVSPEEAQADLVRAAESARQVEASLEGARLELNRERLGAREELAEVGCGVGGKRKGGGVRHGGIMPQAPARLRHQLVAFAWARLRAY
tara:strand:- start:245 stop:592 length:348 start_codon:yes stop_codon:yes gene_type:complete